MNVSEHRKYFNRKKPSGAITLLVFGILFFLLGISIDGGFLWAIIGVAMSAGGTYLIVKFSSNQSDSAIDNFCNTQAHEYCNTKKVIVDSQGNGITDAIYSSGYCFENIFSARRAIRGKDNIWRSSIFEMSCMFFTEDMVYYYSKKISLITDEKSEKQKDFRLQDIQMVSLEEINQSIVVAIAIPGNEKIYVNCRNKEEAIELCDKVKSKAYKRDQTE